MATTRWLAVALVGFAISCGGGGKARTSQALGYIPADARVVIGFNADGLGDPFAKAFIKDIESDPGYRAWRTACGRDPLRSFERFTLAIRDFEAKSGVVVVQGDGMGALLECSSKDEPDLRRDGEVVLYGRGSETAALVRVDDSTLVGVFGAGASAAELREVVKGGPSLAEADGFASLIAKIDTGDAIWIAARGSALKELGLDKDVVSVGASIELGERVGFEAIIRFDDDSDARLLAELAKGVLDDKVDSFDVSRDGGDVTIEAKLSRSDTKKLLREVAPTW